MKELFKKENRKKNIPVLWFGFLFLDKNDMPMVALHWEKNITIFADKT